MNLKYMSDRRVQSGKAISPPQQKWPLTARYGPLILLA